LGRVRLSDDGGLVIDFMAKKKVDTSLEDKFDKLLTDNGIDGYERNCYFIPKRRFRADFWFPELKLVFEVDGGLWLGARGGHTSGAGSHRDRERDILAYRADGIVTFRFGTNHLKEEDEVLKWVTDIIDRRKDEVDVC